MISIVLKLHFECNERHEMIPHLVLLFDIFYNVLIINNLVICLPVLTKIENNTYMKSHLIAEK